MKHSRAADWLGWVVGVVARLWLSTLRVRVQYDAALEPVRHRPWVLAFWHGTQWPLLAWHRRRRTVVLVSWSRDGALQARALTMQGLCVVRGSSSRGGARGLAALVAAMQREGADSAFAVDGPRGPRGVAKAGAVVAAKATGAVVVPMAGAVRCGLVLRRSWDQFAIAWPFTRVDVMLGRPIEPTGDARGEVERAIRQLNVDLAEPFAAEASARRGQSRRFPLGRPGVVPPPERWIWQDTVPGKSVRIPR